MKNKPGMYAKKSDLVGQQSSAAAIEDFDPLEFIAQKTISVSVHNDKYTPTQKFEACFNYFLTQNLTKTGQLTGIPSQTIGYWKNKSAWWKEIYAFIKRAKNEELDGRLSDAMDLAVGELFDRLSHGDEQITKDGVVVRRRVSAKDSATILAILFDKRALLRGDPSTNMHKESTDALLKQLGDAFTSHSGPTSLSIEKSPKKPAEEVLEAQSRSTIQ